MEEIGNLERIGYCTEKIGNLCRKLSRNVGLHYMATSHALVLIIFSEAIKKKHSIESSDEEILRGILDFARDLNNRFRGKK